MRSKRQKIQLLVCLLCLIFCFTHLDVKASKYGEDANLYKKQLNQLQGATEAEQSKQVQDFLTDRIIYMGYRPVESPISNPGNTTEEGKNIIFQRKGQSDRIIILEACYKNNDSGVAVLLEMANQLASQKELPYSIRFLLTDVEETWGSTQYLNQLTEEEKDNIVAVVSLNTAEDQAGIQMQAAETVEYQWLGNQIKSIADQIGIELPSAVKLPSIWERDQIPQVSISISDIYTQFRNTAMLLDVWIGNAKEKESTLIISEQYRRAHEIGVSSQMLTFYGMSVERVIEIIIITACGACTLVFFFQLECRRRRRRRKEGR